METEYTTAEEKMNGLTHGVGVVFSVAGLAVLVVCAAVYGDVWHVVSFSIFGSSLVILYAASTIYHSVRRYSVKRFFWILDHSAIFILIAGSYTPFMLVSLRGGLGWSLFGIIWGAAILGIILKTLYIGRFEKLSLAIYLVMGWLCVAASKQILAEVSGLSLLFLFLGGLSYTFGVIFFAWERLPFNHGIWHLCVLGGSVFHYFSVLFLLQAA